MTFTFSFNEEHSKTRWEEMILETNSVMRYNADIDEQMFFEWAEDSAAVAESSVNADRDIL